MTQTCGIEWSEGQQDVVIDEQARVVARVRIAEDVAGFSQLLALLAEHSNGEPASNDIAIETDKGLLVAASRGRVRGVPDQSPGRGSVP